MIETTVLSACAVFFDVSQERLEEIAGICTMQEFEPDGIIFKQGDEAQNLYGLVSGEVELLFIFKDFIQSP